MTDQVAETLHYQGHEYAMRTEPLGQYFQLMGIEPVFNSMCSALWRGYVGTWEIKGGRLYLVKVGGFEDEDPSVTLARFFPGYPDRVFAHWYSGTLRIPESTQWEFIVASDGRPGDRDFLIDVERGMVKGTSVKVDDQSAPVQATGAAHHATGAMKIFESGGEQ